MKHEAMGHAVYRDWCRHCIAGRAIGQPHRTRAEEQRARNLVPTIVDYAFMSRSDEDDDPSSHGWAEAHPCDEG